MHNVMNRHLNKITPAGLLRSPPNEGTMGGSQGSSQGNGNDSNNSNGSESNNSGTGDDNGNGSGSSSEEDGFDLLDPDADSDEIELNDDSDESYELTDDQKAAGESLKTQILSNIESFKIDESSIPDDFDPTDKKQLATFMATQQQQAMRSTIAMIPSIINHALGVTMSQMEKKLGSAVNSKTKQSEATQLFNEMGYEGQDKVVAKSFYQRALQNKMAPKDAKKATERAMKQLGLSTGKSSSRAETSSRKEGADALAGFFGSGS